MSRGLGHDREELQPAAGVCPGRDRPACASTWINQTCGHRAAGEAKGTFQRTSTLRLSKAASPAGPRRLAGELEELYRIHREEGLTVRKRGCLRRAIGTRAPMAIPQGPNQRWSLDFVADSLSDGRRFRVRGYPCMVVSDNVLCREDLAA